MGGYHLEDICRGSSVIIEIRQLAGRPGSIPGRAENFSLRHRLQIGSEAHSASSPMGAGGSFPGGKAAGA